MSTDEVPLQEKEGEGGEVVKGEQKPKPTLKEKLKSKYERAKTYIKQKKEDTYGTSGIAVISVIVASLTLATLLFLFGWNLFLSNSPAFYRGVLLSGNAVFAMVQVALFFDLYYGAEMFDFWTGFIVAVITTFFDVFVIVIEIQRWRRCPGAISPIDFNICAFHAGQEAVVPWFAVGVTVLFSIGLLLLIIWYGMLADPLTQEKMAKRRATRDKYLEELPNVAIGVMSAFSLAAILFVMIWEIIPVFDDGPLPSAFYRGTFLVIPAAFFGAEFAYFGHTNRGFAIVTFILGIIANFSLIWAFFVYEVERFFRCALGHVSSMALDNDICNNEGWLAFLLPSVMAFLLITGIATWVLILLRAFFSDWKKLAPKEKD